MNIVLTAKRDGVLYIDEDGNESKVYEGYEVHIDDAESVSVIEESGELVADIIFPASPTDVSDGEVMYPLKDWDLSVMC